MAEKPYLEDVKQQYEAFPYPPRSPADEARRLVCPISGSLPVVNHHCLGGMRDFRAGFRCLVAGGGTGDSTNSLISAGTHGAHVPHDARLGSARR